MSDIKASVPIKRCAISITVTRADGRVEDLGVVALQDDRWWERLRFALAQRLKRPYRKDF